MNGILVNGNDQDRIALEYLKQEISIRARCNQHNYLLDLLEQINLLRVNKKPLKLTPKSSFGILLLPSNNQLIRVLDPEFFLPDNHLS